MEYTNLKLKIADLELMLTRYNIHIAALSEPWLEPDTDLRFSNSTHLEKTDRIFTGEWQFCVTSHLSQSKHAYTLWMSATQV